jgi:hypothetical protein
METEPEDLEEMLKRAAQLTQELCELRRRIGQLILKQAGFPLREPISEAPLPPRDLKG